MIKGATKKGPGYELWFGKYKGKTVEQLMFVAGGQQYLSWIIGGMQHPRYERLVLRVENVRDRGRSRMIKGKCHCNKGKAKYFSISNSGYNLGISPANLYCDQCKDNAPENAEILPVSFKAALLFRDAYNQEAYIRVLKYAFFGDSNKIVTKKRAFELFYPEHVI